MYCIHSLLMVCVFLSFLLGASLGFASPSNTDVKQTDSAVSASSEQPQQPKLITQARGFFDRWWQRDQLRLSSATAHQQPLSESAMMAERSLDDAVTAHFETVAVDVLIEYLAPADWTIHFDIAKNRLQQQVVFHAETSRRRALDNLLNQVGLQGIFYPQSRMIVIAQGSTL